MAFNQSGRRRRRQNSFPEQIHDQSPNNPTRVGQLLLLKDFLNDDYSSTISSSSSSSTSDFTSIPRFLPSSSIQSPRDSSVTVPLHRNRSRSWIAPAEATISLIQKILAAVMKSPSGDRRMKRNRTREEEEEAVKPPRMEEEDERNVVGIVGGIRVKDILRWESFREEDLALAETDDRSEEEMDDVAMVGLSSVKSSPPLDMSPVRTPEIDTSFSELLSSVVNGDGAAVDVAATTSNSDESERLTSPRFGVGSNTWDSVDTIEGPTTATTTTECEPDDTISEDQDQHDNDNNNNDDHQHSPVSILDSPFRDNDDDGETSTTSTSMSAFEETMASVERSKQRLLDSIKWFESLAAGVVNAPFSYDDDDDDEDEKNSNHAVLESAEEEEELVKETSLSASQIGKESTNLHHLTLDKLKNRRYERLLFLNQSDRKGSEYKVLHRCYNNVRSDLNWSSFGSTQREECLRDMESAADDDDVEQQQKQLLGCELEDVMFNDLLDHLVFDL